MPNQSSKNVVKILGNLKLKRNTSLIKVRIILTKSQFLTQPKKKNILKLVEVYRTINIKIHMKYTSSSSFSFGLVLKPGIMLSLAFTHKMQFFLTKEPYSQQNFMQIAHQFSHASTFTPSFSNSSSTFSYNKTHIVMYTCLSIFSFLFIFFIVISFY